MLYSRNDPDEYCREHEENENDLTLNKESFMKEKAYIAKSSQVNERDVEIDVFHPVGEYCIFIKGRWYGYLDDNFYEAMRLNITPIEFENHLDELYEQLS